MKSPQQYEQEEPIPFLSLVQSEENTTFKELCHCRNNDDYLLERSTLY